MYLLYINYSKLNLKLKFYLRLVKWVTSKIVIDNYKSRKKINDALPRRDRRDIGTISDLKLPMFQGAAIGCLQEASEAYIVS